MTCQTCYHDDETRERCNINRPGYPFCGSRCAAYLPQRQPHECADLGTEQVARCWPLSRIAGVVGWLFGGGV